MSAFIKTLKINEISEWIFAFLLFILMQPFFVWKWEPNIENIAIVICFCISLYYMNINKENGFALFVLFYLYIYMTIKNNGNINYFFSSVLRWTLFITSTSFLSKATKKFIIVYSITLIPSIITYLLVNAIGIQISHTSIQPNVETKLYDYICYPFMIYDSDPSFLLRFYAYYIEAGTVGTVSGILFVCNGFSLKKIINIPIFIAGILSLSLSFYLIIFLYGIFFLQAKYKIIFAVIVIGLFIFIFNENEVVNHFIVDRLAIKNGKLVGDNRITRYFDVWYDNFKKTDDFYWGLGKEMSLKANFGGASYKDLIVSYGIFFFIFYILSFTIIAYNRFGLKKHFYVFMFLFLAVLYQRPFIYRYFYSFLLYVPIIYLPACNNINQFRKKTGILRYVVKEI